MILRRMIMKAIGLVLVLALLLSGCSQSVPTATPPETVTPSDPTVSPPVETVMPSDSGDNLSETPQPSAYVPITSGRVMDFKDMEPFELTRDLRVGWNNGNALDSFSIFAKSPKGHETAMGNPPITEEMVKLLADTGFGALRIPIVWQTKLGPAPDFIIDPAWFERIKEIVDWGIDNELYVIINMHHEYWHFPSYELEDSVKEQITAVWTQIAVYFKDYSEKLIFETFNEPRPFNTPEEWSGGTAESRDVLNRYNQTALETIRASGGHNDKRYVLIPAIAASGEAYSLNGFIMPDDPNVILSVHAYTPYDFALMPGGRSDWSSSNVADTAPITSLFDRLEEMFLSKGIPVIMGEFGAVNRQNPEQRMDWLQFYLETASEHGVPCIWWDNGSFGGTGELFGLMERANVKWDFPEIVEMMVEYGKPTER